MNGPNIYTIAIQKGGTAKSTTAAALAGAARQAGLRTLLIDLDPQANLTYTTGATADGPGAYALFTGERPAADLITTTPAGDLIPASWALAAIKTEGAGSARRLATSLEPIQNAYDVIIIDTPPTAGELQYNALMTATDLVIPLTADIYSLQSLYQVNATAQAVRRANDRLKIAGGLITQYDSRSTIARTMCEKIQGVLSSLGVPYLGSVRRAVAVSEAAALQVPLFEYAPKSKPAQDYRAIFDKLYKH